MSSEVAAGPSERFQQILGVRFFDGTPAGAVDYIKRVGGYVVVPAAPGLVKLRYDAAFRAALVQSDLAIADSGLMVLLWKLLERREISRISGLTYLKCLLELPEIRQAGKIFWVLPTASAAEKARSWLRDARFPATGEDFYIPPFYGTEVSDEVLADKINARRPSHVIVAIGGGPQEKLGLFLRNHLGYRPAIHCIGAALGFLTGDQIAIPDWADRLYLGWLFRLLAQPRVFIPRLWSALELPWLIFKYREQLPEAGEKS
ncbi:MAG: N-acetylglucosaminyldiphosphoundecaprenol N-acetyl-beta-D-mannosaminyltransferase [Verrucomicrobiota bacterium]|jgi:exopolysaccharide biosynthesis WecB/TagA/CpsF family protein